MGKSQVQFERRTWELLSLELVLRTLAKRQRSHTVLQKKKKEDYWSVASWNIFSLPQMRTGMTVRQLQRLPRTTTN